MAGDASTTDATVGLERLGQGLLAIYPDEAAMVLERHDLAEARAVLARAPAPAAAAVLERLSTETAADLIADLDPPILGRISAALDPTRAVGFVARLAPDVRRERLTHSEPAAAREIESLLVHLPGSAGALMDPRVTTCRAETTVAAALTRIRGRHAERIGALFVVDGEGRLEGVVELSALALALPEQRLGALARGVVAAVQPTDGREEVVERLGRTRLPVLPVVDFAGRLLGVIRHDALVKAVEEEASVDLQTMVGASKEERALSPVGFAIRKRLPWLEINLATAFLAASVVGLFEATIAKFTALAVLLPVVAGQSGNTGAQARAREDASADLVRGRGGVLFHADPGDPVTMRYAPMVRLVALVLGIVAPAAAGAIMRDDVERALAAASVAVEPDCTGVLADGPALVFTAAHCIDGRASVDLTFSDGVVRIGWVAVIDRVADQAVLLLEEPVAITPLALAPRRPFAGMVVYFAGDPRDSRFREVKIQRVGRTPSLPLLQGALYTTIVGKPGDAGAPIVDSAARVVGLVHRDARYDIGTPAAAMRRLVERLLRAGPLRSLSAPLK